MLAIVCTDDFGGKHDVEVDEMMLFTAAYGIAIKDNTVLLVQEKATNLWRFPGGKVEKTERDVEAMKRWILIESGISVLPEVKLAHIMEEDYFNTTIQEGSHVTRMFYYVTGETTATNPQIETIEQASYVPLDTALRFSDKEMIKKYRDILKKTS